MHPSFPTHHASNPPAPPPHTHLKLQLARPVDRIRVRHRHKPHVLALQPRQLRGQVLFAAGGAYVRAAGWGLGLGEVAGACAQFSVELLWLVAWVGLVISWVGLGILDSFSGLH